MILTFLMSQAQAESESMSTSIKWGYRKRFADGVVYYHYDTLLGYRKGPDGGPEIDPDEAPVVRRIFARFLMGQSYQQICDGLMAEGIKTVTGSGKWYSSTIKSILQNEKYIGDAILGRVKESAVMSLRIVRSVTSNSIESLAVVVCRSLRKISMIALWRSDGFNRIHPPSRNPCWGV